MQTVITLSESTTVLTALGRRLRSARVARNQTMAVFAARIGVSVPTLRAMERGAPTVQVGAWANALWALDRVEDFATVLAERASLLERARAAAQAPRKRPYTRRTSAR